MGIAQGQVVLLSEDFSDGERSTQNLTSSSAWFASSSSATLTVASQALVRTGTNFSLTYFTTTTAPRQLAVGDSLRVTFSMAFTESASVGVGGDFLRAGLFNSFATAADGNATTTANRISTDNTSSSHVAFTDNAGYMITASFAPTAASTMKTRERSTGATSLFSLVNPPFTTNYTSGGTDLDFVSGNTYSADFSVTRTGSGVNVSLSYAGNFIDSLGATVSATQSASFSDTTPVYTFDMFGINQSNANISSTTIDNFVVTYTAVPEPSSIVGLLIGSILLVFGNLVGRSRWSGSDAGKS